MSILQEILRTMIVDPDLLSEMSDLQKEQLFEAMRAEQIRRWKEFEEEETKKGAKKGSKNEEEPKPKPGKKGNVRFMLDKDKNPWTWVMGEHPDDKSIDDIIEEEAQRKAQALAEQEAMEKQEMEEAEAKKKLKETEEKMAEELKKEEEENRKKAEEAAIYQSLKEARLLKEKMEEEKRKKEEESAKKLKQIKKEHEQRKRSSILEIEQSKQKRTSELFNSFKLERKRNSILAEQQSVELDQEWKQQEEKAKAAEKERRELARNARVHVGTFLETLKLQSQVLHKAMGDREDFRRKRQTKENNDPKDSKFKAALPRKPPNRQAIISWFKEFERPKGAGLDPKTDQLADWFHGIISREEAVELLDAKPIGSFIVRVSERIWGYAISYKNANRVQHFLIDTSDGYRLFGPNQTKHDTLSELIVFFKTHAISASGQEMLKYPCRRLTPNPLSCQELFGDCDPETTTL